jgi:hypothetical protein
MEAQLLAPDQLQAGVTAGELAHGDLGFELAQVRAEAVVQALTEGQVLVRGLAVQVELIWPVEYGRVSSRGGQPQEEPGPRRQVNPGQAGGASGDPPPRRYRRIVAKGLFDRRGDEVRRAR